MNVYMETSINQLIEELRTSKEVNFNFEIKFLLVCYLWTITHPGTKTLFYADQESNLIPSYDNSKIK